MNDAQHHFAQQAAAEVYFAFIDECLVPHVGADRVGKPAKPSVGKIDGRPVRLVTISGKGGWSEDSELAEHWTKNDNISLLDHLLSVARGALMFWLVDAPRPWSSSADLEEIARIGHAVVSIAFLHDIDKDLSLPRGTEITVDAVAERMHRYGVDQYLRRRNLRISPAAMRNYIEEVEGTQTARSPAASDYDRRIAATCRYVELADKLEGKFTSREPDGGIDGVITSLRAPDRWPVLRDASLRRWRKIEIHDHLHVFLLDRFQRALSAACTEVSGRLPLIEVVHDGWLLCVIPEEQAARIEDHALHHFLGNLPYRLDLSINNKLACKFVGGAASWRACHDLMKRTGDWRRDRANLLALPRAFAIEHQEEIDTLFEAAGMATSWSPLEGGTGATVKPAFDYPGGDAGDLNMEPAHALTLLVATLNHADAKRRNAASSADVREQELSDLLNASSKEPPPVIAAVPAKERRTRRVVLSLWAIAEVWHLEETDPDAAKELLDRIVGRGGLVGLWLEGNETRTGLANQIVDEAGQMLDTLRRRFTACLGGVLPDPVDRHATKRCILCNEPVAAARKVDTAARAHGIKASAFSGRDGRNDHLSSPSGDTHLCRVCLAELQLRQIAQEKFKGSGNLPPLISSPTTTGLFGGLAFQREGGDLSMGLNDLNRLDLKKGAVYHALDCQTRRIRLARLEDWPNKDAELVEKLRMALKAVQRVGRPLHIFRGAPRRHSAIFYADALPEWLQQLLGGDSLRIEQIPDALGKLGLFENIANVPGLGIGWAKQLADPSPAVRLGALCVAWALAADHADSNTKHKQAMSVIRNRTRERALTLITNNGGNPMNLRDSDDPLIRLAWLATLIQKRLGIGAATNKQLLCWKTALDFFPGAERSTSVDPTALTLGLAGTLEEELTRKNDAAAKKHRDGRPLDEACIDFARHFTENVWTKVFRSKEPTSREQRRAASIYRFALLEAYRERGIAESETGVVLTDEDQD
ncbi:MAG: hypothetical protein OXI80_11560 [Caldilineaceae bacterium]|nr:hypothetical protein [Caldilineaceae bacterium]